MVAPVAKLCSRGGWVWTFPINAFTGNAVRIEAINGHSVDELSEHVWNVFRVGNKESFPVLENITPVAFVVEYLIAVLIGEGNVELVPRSGWVAMSAGEDNRHVLEEETGQLFVAIFENLIAKSTAGNGFL